jgi:hypothetical protein
VAGTISRSILAEREKIMALVKFQYPANLWNDFISKTENPHETIRNLMSNYTSWNMDNLVSCQEAAEVWGLSPHYIKNLARLGEIKAKCIGKTWVIDLNQPNPKKY